MKLRLLILITLLFFSLSCDQSSPIRDYKPIDPESCNSRITRTRADFDELDIIDSDNVSEYRISGTCENENAELKIYIEGYPLDDPPVCNRRKWEISVDITGIVNQKERIQFAVSQPGERGLLCKNTSNHFVCPRGYIGVAEFDNFTSAAFCVMKYEAKTSSDINKGSFYNRPIIKAEAIASGNVITKINESDAIKYCKENGVGYDLINNDEWQTIARHIESVAVNWSQNTTKIQNGNILNIGSTRKETSSNNDNITDQWKLNKRTHKLPNNEYIWDLSGSVSELVQHSIQSLPTTYTGYIYKLPTSLKRLFGPDRDYTILDDRERRNSFAGLGFMEGRRLESGLIRGGGLRGFSRRNVGIFSVDTTIDTNNIHLRGLNVGFRCTYHP